MMHQRSKTHRYLYIGSSVVAFILFLLIMYNETPMKKGKPILYFPSSSIEAVSKTLEENGYELNRFDRFALHFVTLPKEGWYRLKRNTAGRFMFLKNLHKNEARTISIRIFAGETSSELFHRLARDMILSEAKLQEYYEELARFKEANILAGRYTLARSANEETVIRYLFDHSYGKIDLFAREKFGDNFSTKELRKALIIASVIQKESNDINEMPYISSVIHNRLKKNMRLQMDGTLNYGKYARTIVTPERIRTDKSKYNTYKHKGLPPAPLGTVSMDALKAAVSPHKSNYLFFVLNKEGKHDFVETYQKHLKNVKTFKAHLREQKEEKEAKAVKEQKQEEVKETQKTTKAESKITPKESHAPQAKKEETEPKITKKESEKKPHENNNTPVKKEEIISRNIKIETDTNENKKNSTQVKKEALDRNGSSKIIKLFENLEQNSTSKDTASTVPSFQQDK